MVLIVTARSHFGASPAEMRDRVVEHLEKMGAPRLAIGSPDRVTSSPVGAYVSEGRWVAECPDCNGAELVTPGDPFMCLSCGNVLIGHAYRAVIFPAELAAIEDALAVRAFAVNRNWRPGEMAAQLRAENAQHADRLVRGAR